MGLLFLLILIPFALILGILLPVIAIIDILSSKFSGNDNLLMILIVLFIPFGAIIYFVIAPSRKIAKSYI
ncbi:MAG: PLDc N-terminal domain-containing protein [Paludibacter sp.]|nr:PLDc N-terminal domain-containing protein [Paludibacter sp.]